MVRTSSEYKKWLNFIHGVLGFNFKCYKSGDLSGMCSIEVHHHPITLYNLVSIAIDNTQSFDTFTIGDQVIKWHFQMYVGFIPLNKTNHEMFHNRILNLPIELVEGKYDEFLNSGLVVSEYITSLVDIYKDVKLEGQEMNWAVRAKQIDF